MHSCFPVFKRVTWQDLKKKKKVGGGGREMLEPAQVGQVFLKSFARDSEWTN